MTTKQKCGNYCESHGNYCAKPRGHEGRCNHETESLAPHRFRERTSKGAGGPQEQETANMPGTLDFDPHRPIRRFDKK